MLNLLQFNKLATYADGSDPELSGFETYMRYGAKVMVLITKRGGEITFGAQANTLVIGDDDL